MDEFPNEFVKPYIKLSFDLLSRYHIHIYNGKLYYSLSKLSLITTLVGCAIFYISEWAYMSKISTGDLQFIELAYTVPAIVVSTQGILKGGIVLSKKYKIRALIQTLGSMWLVDDPRGPQIEKRNLILKRPLTFNAVVYWFALLGTWQYMLIPLVEALIRKFVLQQQPELRLPFGCSLPFNTTTTWTRYFIFYGFEVYAMSRIIYLYLAPDVLMMTLCAHLSSEFILLQEYLRDVKPTSSKNNLEDTFRETSEEDLRHNMDSPVDEIVSYHSHDMTLKDFVRRHQGLIKLSEELDDIFNVASFINLLCSSVTICFFGFTAMMSRTPAIILNNFVGATASMLFIFILCYYGELLNRASTGIADSAYEIKWYKGDIKFQKMLLFVMRRAQRPCCLTSLKYKMISLTTFTAVMSTTWSYFSLTLSVYDEEK